MNEHEFCYAEWHRCDGGGKGEYDRYIADGRMGVQIMMPGRCANSPRRDTEPLGGPMLSQPTCSIPDCDRPRKHGRYCNPCYSLVRGQDAQRTPADRFWAKVARKREVLR